MKKIRLRRSVILSGIAVAGITMLGIMARQNVPDNMSKLPVLCGYEDMSVSAPPAAASGGPWEQPVQARAPEVSHAVASAVARGAPAPATRTMAVEQTRPGNPLSNPVAEMIARAQELDRWEEPTPPGLAGTVRRKRLVKTAEFKYPILVVEEVLEPAADGTERMVATRAMVADHIIVKLRAQTGKEELARLSEQHGARIKRQMLAPNTYLVQIARPTLAAVEDAVKAHCRAATTVLYAEPDYLVYALDTPNDPSFPQLWGLHNVGQVPGATGMVTAGGATRPGTTMIYSGVAPAPGVTGTLYNCGQGHTGEFPAGVNGNIALIQRGDITFAQKAANAMAAGATAVVIYNNVPGAFFGTLGTPGAWPPVLAISYTDGAALLALGNVSATVVVGGSVVDADIDAPEAWNVSHGSSSVVVGVIDTGIEYTHPDIAANMWTNPGEIAGNGIDDDGNGYVDDVYGYNFVGNNGNPSDDQFHGTHCAGTIGAVGNNGVGVVGVCWNVRLMALKFLDANGSGAISDAVRAVTYATQMGVKITSNSWGGGGFNQAMKDAIDEAGAAGALFVAAAGNSANNNDASPFYPSGYDSANIIAVAATDCDDGLALFSCYGATSVDLGAPGVNIYSTFPTYMTAAMIQGNFPTNYATISGTSMATPHVAGACALLRSEDPTLSVAAAKARLYYTSDRLAALDGKCTTGGRLNAFKALAPPPAPEMRVWHVAVDDAVGGNGDGYVNPGETVRVTLTLANVGLDPAMNVEAALSSGDPTVTIDDAQASFGSIPGFSEKQVADAFTMTIASSITAHMAELDLNITDGAGAVWTDTVRIAIRTWHRIAGAVTVDGAPSAGVNVYCRRANEYVYAGEESAADGTYEFNVLDGAYVVWAQGRSPLGNVYSEALEVTVPPDVVDLDFAFATTSISGYVTDSRTGSPLPGATVLGVYNRHTYFSGSTFTDADGRYELAVLTGSPIELDVTAWKAGYAHPPTQTFALPPAATNIDFSLSRPDLMAAATPSSIEVWCLSDGSPTRTLTIGNQGPDDLDWRLWLDSDQESPSAGQVIRTVQIPDYNPDGVHDWQGLAYDGQTLWVGDYALSYFNGGNVHLVQQLDAENGNVLRVDTSYWLSYGPDAFDWDGHGLWMADHLYRELVVGNPDSLMPRKILDTGLPTSRVAIGDGCVWVDSGEGFDPIACLRKLDPNTGAELGVLPIPAETRAEALEYFGGALWVMGNGRIWKLSPQHGGVMRSFAAPDIGNYLFKELADNGAGAIWVLANKKVHLVNLGDVPWLSAAVAAGTVPAGQNRAVTLAFDAHASGLGIHTATANILSSGPDRREIQVPIVFRVTESAPPVIAVEAWANPNPVTPPGTAALGVIAHDPDGDPLIYTWSKVSGPGSVSFIPNGTGSSDSSVAGFDVAGAYVLRVTVSNGRIAETATSEVTVQALGMITDAATIAIPEGGSAPLRVRLSAPPSGDLVVTVTRSSGDPDISIESPASVIFTPADWDTWQTITLAAAEDPDADDGTARVTLSAPGLADREVTAVEQENDTTILINAGPGGTVSPAGRIVVTKGVAVPIIATPGNGRGFGRWIVTQGLAAFDNHLSPQTTVTVTMPATIRANFSPAPAIALAWGRNNSGQLGDGTTTSRSLPTPVRDLADTCGVWAGGYHSFAAQNDGSAWAWGRNASGQLGIGTTDEHHVPVSIPLLMLTNVQMAAGGNNHSLLLSGDGRLHACGYNLYGQLGTGGPWYSQINPVLVMTNVIAAAAGADRSAAVTADGSVWWWGYVDRFSGQEDVCLTVPTLMTGLVDCVAVAVGDRHTLALKADGSVWAWGKNSSGQLGNGTQIDSYYTPVRVLASDGSPLSGVVAIAAGNNRSHAVTVSGGVWSWGQNSYGALGDGTTLTRNKAVQAITADGAPLTGVAAVGAGAYHTVALKAEGSVWTWGSNTEGELGNGTFGGDKRLVAGQVPGLANVSGISVGASHTLVFKEIQPYVKVVTDVASVEVPEGGTAMFRVKLDSDPYARVTVLVEHASGDADIGVQSGASLVFSPADWDVYRTVTLAAAEDADAKDGSAEIRISGYGVDVGATVTATEQDNDTTLTVYAASGGTVTPNGSVVVTKGAAAGIAAAAKTGYAFVNWTVLSGSATIAEEGAADTPVTIATPATIQANFTSVANHAPVAYNRAVTTDKNTARTITLVGTDPDGNALTYAIATGPAHGSLSAVVGSSVTYTPVANYVGNDSFTFRANDSQLDSNEGTISISVSGDADPMLVMSIGSTASRDQFVIRWQSASNRWYIVQAATNLLSGFNLNLRTNIPATYPVNVYTDDTATVRQKFYRIRVQE